ncbi:MAG: single-stranded-DNA-specific exonuclease RecJ [Clostridia bacterium]|nr:single-stranded-DNA-specific exonuclease RecJ [Clostridia bacterium]
MQTTNEKKRLKRREWVLRAGKSPEERASVSAIAEKLNIHPITAQLLYNRGYKDPASAEAFLRMENESLCDPFELKDAKVGAQRLLKAVENREKITVYGDYDVDGVTAVCTVYLYLKSKGAAVDYYIPNREGDGYGVSRAAIDLLAERGTTLIVTVDTGITANDEIAYASTRGIDVVVTDHHECRSDLPPAVAVINPHRPDCPYSFKELAGVGVAFKFICAYEQMTSCDDLYTCVARLGYEYADLVAIGTIADVMPLVGENKLLVSLGLDRMRKEKRIGLRTLIEASMMKADGKGAPVGQQVAADPKITSSYVGFTLAPRINVAGRVKNASLAVELFLADTYERAKFYAGELCNANQDRQEKENLIMQEAYALIEKEHDLSRDRVLVLDADHWHHGVIGIVASRITESYALPCILISFKGGMSADEPSGDDIGKGSGRSIKGLNLVDALVHSSNRLVKYGGHELAAGLSIKRKDLADFRREINDYARSVLGEEQPVPVIEADCELTFPQIKTSLAREIRRLEPYGTGNPSPLFILNRAIVYEVISLRKGKHTKLMIGDSQSGMRVTAIFFSHSPEEIDVVAGDTVSLLFQLDINEWCGKTTVQMILRDLHNESRQENSFPNECSRVKQRFEEIRMGGTFSASEGVLPNRDDFVSVYQFVRRSIRQGQSIISHEAIRKGIFAADHREIGYIKLKFIIRVLQEMNLLGIEEVSDEVYSFRFYFSSNKVDLEKSNILRRLRVQQRD